MGAALALLDIGTAPADDADLRTRKRAAVGIVIVAAVVPLVFAVAGLAAERPTVTAIALAQTASQFVNLALYRRHQRIGPLVVVTIIIGLLTILSGGIAIGGTSAAGNNIVWTILAPVGTVLLLGRRAALPSFAFFAAVVGVAVLVDPFVRGDEALPYQALLALTAFNVLVPGAVMFSIVSYVDGARLEAQAESDALLRNVLPASIAERLKAGEQVIADHYPDVTVLFSDVVAFTPFAEAHDPRRVVEVLNALFTSFDRLAAQFGLEKIKTIGDAYMVVAGVPDAREDHTQVMLEMGLAIHRAVAAHPPVDGRRLQVRTGIASGPVVAGVIGQRKFSYDLWGDTVNTASRMESSGVPGCIQVTPEVHARCSAAYSFTRRDAVEIKGKGRMTTWLLDPADIPAEVVPGIATALDVEAPSAYPIR